MPVANEAFAWQSSDTDVVTADPVTGILIGISDGTAVVTATRGDKQLSVNVIAEIAPLGFDARRRRPRRRRMARVENVHLRCHSSHRLAKCLTLAFATTSSRKLPAHAREGR